MVITALTRNQVVSNEARGFESHPLRFYYIYPHINSYTISTVRLTLYPLKKFSIRVCGKRIYYLLIYTKDS